MVCNSFKFLISTGRVTFSFFCQYWRRIWHRWFFSCRRQTPTIFSSFITFNGGDENVICSSPFVNNWQRRWLFIIFDKEYEFISFYNSLLWYTCVHQRGIPYKFPPFPHFVYIGDDYRLFIMTNMIKFCQYLTIWI